jgi:hypothetical protein
VRDDWETMSDTESPNGRQGDSVPEGGILAALPRARPQRASPRRAAARSKASKAKTVASAHKPTTARVKSAKARVKSAKAPAPRAHVGQAKTRPTRTTPKAKLPPTKPPEPPAPKQGYEPEEEVELGTTVNPPSGAELVESVGEIVGEIANSGLAAGGRLLKDAFSLLRRS